LSIICPLLQLYWFVLIARILLSWFPVQPGTFLAQVNSVIYTLTEPVLGPLRRAIPPVRLGGMGLDLSPIILFLAFPILMRAIGC
jgi:YggT family protein